MSIAEPLLLTTEQVAELLQVSRWWVYDHGHELGRIEGMRPHRYLRERVEEYVRERAARPPSPPSPSPFLRAVPPPSEQSFTRKAPQPSATRRQRPRRVPLLEPGGRAA